MNVAEPAREPTSLVPSTSVRVLVTLSFCHLLNDLLQGLLPSIYPMLKAALDLDFRQIGLITLANQITASLLQPIIGGYTDRRPHAYSLVLGMVFTLGGMLLLSVAATFPHLLMAAALIGLGSSVFHPESSRIARLASGGRHGFAQSFFQVGGNAGSALGPLLAALVVLPRGQSSLAWFALAAILAILLLWRIGNWYKGAATFGAGRAAASRRPVSIDRRSAVAIAILLALIFSKYVYLASLGSYYTFYLIERFGVTVQSAQLHLFLFLGAVAVGTLLGGPVGDRIGARHVIIWSILGVVPFTLALPYVDLIGTRILSVVIGMVLASAFSAIVVYAQELVPGRIGMVAGLFFGVAFGVAGLGAAVLGAIADQTGIIFVYRACAFLPLIGVLALWLPRGRGQSEVR
jgi:FSR family fosmidomycin resistance protein-like MFS transporter